MNKKSIFMMITVCLLLMTAQASNAKVTAEEAEKLKTVLTPFGAEKAGNADGTIPAWDGGYTEVPSGYKSGDPRHDPFADEKPVFSISGKNISQYADKLCEGQKFLLEKYPGYRMDVYPTHRTAAAPARVYDATFKNATRAVTKDGGLSIDNAYGGIPFPIPKTGYEAMWNYLLYWVGHGREVSGGQNWMVDANGKAVLATKFDKWEQYPFYYPDVPIEDYAGEYMLLRIIQTGPPFKVGESFTVRDPLDQYNVKRKAWQYLSGQRRVRRAPSIAYDTPDNVASGQTYWDEAFLFNGSMDRYDWKLLGKKEMIIPYNLNGFFLHPISKVLNPGEKFENPDCMRWEVHRVWVVEATLASGKRHPVQKRRLYLDEDTWLAVLYDGWDEKGELFRYIYGHPLLVYELPGVIFASWTSYNIQSGVRLMNSLTNEARVRFRMMEKPLDEYFFTPNAMRGEGIR